MKIRFLAKQGITQRTATNILISKHGVSATTLQFSHDPVEDRLSGTCLIRPDQLDKIKANGFFDTVEPAN